MSTEHIIRGQKRKRFIETEKGSLIEKEILKVIKAFSFLFLLFSFSFLFLLFSFSFLFFLFFFLFVSSLLFFLFVSSLLFFLFVSSLLFFPFVSSLLFFSFLLLFLLMPISVLVSSLCYFLNKILEKYIPTFHEIFFGDNIIF